MEMIQTGSEFRAWRLSRGFSQKGAAKVTGINSSTLSRIETKDMRVDRRWVEKLSGQGAVSDSNEFIELITRVMSLDSQKREVIRLICGG